MRLYKTYCKEIIRQFQKIPVYLPGEFVQVGDVIFFNNAGLFGSKPIGTFKKRTSLSNLGIEFPTLTDPDPRPYKFSSVGSVSMEFTSEGEVTNQAKGQLDIAFTKEGATYLVAVDCLTTAIDDLLTVERQLANHVDALDWSSHYIVVAVTVASRSLIMQSNSSSASLSIKGEVKAFDTGSVEMPNIDAALSVKSYKDASFIKDWSNNVAVFFELVRFRNFGLKGFDRTNMLFEKTLLEVPLYRLENVSASEGLIEEE